MVNYENGKIYKIESHVGDKVYIGSTTKEYLSQRMDTHRKDYKKWKNNKRGLTTSFNLFEEYGLENCKIILLESYPCSSKDELIARESYYIKTIDCVNKVIPDRTKQEYYKDNKEKHNEQTKLWYLNNIDTHKMLSKKWYEANKEKIKEKYEANKELIKAKRRERYQLNKQNKNI
jgi:hypothetical protein